METVHVIDLCLTVSLQASCDKYFYNYILEKTLFASLILAHVTMCANSANLYRMHLFQVHFLIRVLHDTI